MQEIRRLIVERLAADGALLALAPGGIYDRPLKPGNTPGGTPAAWYVDPADPTRVPHLRRSLVVMDGGEVDPPDGPSDPVHPWELRQTFPRIFIYVDATANGKAAADAIDARCLALLNGWTTPLSLGTALTLTQLNRTELIESDTFDGVLFCFRRFLGEYLRPREV
jgi:hypothetical protein